MAPKKRPRTRCVGHDGRGNSVYEDPEHPESGDDAIQGLRNRNMEINSLHLLEYLSGQVICIRRRNECGCYKPLFCGKLAPNLLQEILKPGDRILNESGQDVEVLEQPTESTVAGC